MNQSGRPSDFSLHLAGLAAIGHINAGLNSYRQFEEFTNRSSEPGTNLDVNRAIELGVPAVTNLALGLELLVKLHHFQVSGSYPFGHDIKQLGSAFSGTELANLRAIYAALYTDPSINKGLEFRYSGGYPGREPTTWPLIDFSNYDLAIAHVGPMYVKWRYIYEEIQQEFDLRMAFGPLYFLAWTFFKAASSHSGNSKVKLPSPQFIELRP